MTTTTIQQQYDELIAPRYDLDPQGVTGSTLDRAAEQIRSQGLLEHRDDSLQVYDVGMGTGMFLTRLMALAPNLIEPFGLDLSQKMIDCAYQKLPGLAGAVDTAANLDAHFPEYSFDLICTHFISGFVPLHVLAPKVWSRLEDGGYWSFLGATKSAYPNLQAKANNKFLRFLFGGQQLDIDNMVLSPKNQRDVHETLERNGFVVRQCETYQPKLQFANLEDFLKFAYYGGWLTPFVDAIGLHNAGALSRWILDRFFFPLEDHHCIEIHLAQKVSH
ncbi:MAG: class I SAM-dependent methyltransferase [Alphaproteobacteria bacterium]|nr:class I SAM-dependent methyltransferase [Alphaproteobacteria bacterium]